MLEASLKKIILLLLASSLSFATGLYAAKNQDACVGNTTFNVGAGIYDITGPAAEEGMMGYGMLKQKTAGIYQRLWARAFIIESPCNGKRVVFVNADLGQVFQGIKQQVVKQLQTKFGDLYNDQNVLITATHEHSGPGGYSTYTFYNLTTLGFNRDNFNAIIDGIVQAVARAQDNMMPAQIKIAEGELAGISFNRSPTAYLLNPLSERTHYAGDTDTKMTLLRFDSLSNQPIGMLNWFAIHGVSMNNKNHLINGDNKGYAEYLFEQDFHSDYGPNAFVAAFAQANAGDVSPNQLGHEGGTGNAGLQAVEHAGLPQYEKAKALYNDAHDIVAGGVDYRHSFIKMDEVLVRPEYTDGKLQQTCPAAIGVSMLAGTQDGEGVGEQGITCDTIQHKLPYFICELSRTKCQGVKPIALQTGLMKPYPWTPNILPFQLIKIGNIVIVAAPFELTTMTGRRIREVVQQSFPDHHVLLSALANAYSGYVATNEEYQLQRYEAASTHFGPWTEAALRQTFAELAQALAHNKPVVAGPNPPDLSGFQITLQPGVIFDAAPLNKNFGDIASDVREHYDMNDTVIAIFWGAHPKNNFRRGESYLAIQHYQNGEWLTLATDNDWTTEFHWQRSGIASSLITIRWRIPDNTPKGLYRIAHFGDAKSILGGITPYTGYSSPFTVG